MKIVIIGISRLRKVCVENFLKGVQSLLMSKRRARRGIEAYLDEPREQRILNFGHRQEILLLHFDS